VSDGNGSATFADFPTSQFKGVVVAPGDPGYAEAREIPNARHILRQPALIVRCTDADDIVTAVNYAVSKDIKIAVRSGGHAIDGHAMPDGAYVIDTSLMKGITVDPDTGVTTLEAGVLLGEMDAATQEYGYVVPAGTVSETGAAGLTLGGGMGYLTRRFGMTVDNVLSIDVVTMDGRKLTASADENAELFWGLRGAGHNLAIATSFTYQAHKVGPEVMSGLMIYPIDAAVPVLTNIDAAMAKAPRELTIYPVILPAPPLPGLPEAMIGVPIFVLIAVYTGELDKYGEAIAPIHALGAPVKLDGSQLDPRRACTSRSSPAQPRRLPPGDHRGDRPDHGRPCLRRAGTDGRRPERRSCVPDPRWRQRRLRRGLDGLLA